MVLLSDELWLKANNSKSFAYGSNPIIKNNLRLCKHSEIYFTLNFQKHNHGSNGTKIYFSKERYIKQINDIW